MKVDRADRRRVGRRGAWPGLALCCAIAALAPSPLRAEMLDLGNIKPQLSLYGVDVEPQINVRADLLTRATELNLKLDTYSSLERDVLVAKVREIAGKKLPWPIKAGTCTINITELQSFTFNVTGNTGDLTAEVRADPDGCPLWPGTVRVAARFTPQPDKTVLRVSLASVEVKVPTNWSVAAFFAGLNPNAEVAAKIRKFISDDVKYELPAIQGGRAAFQGASLDLKGGAVILRIRADAQLDRAQAATLFQNLPQIKELKYRLE